MKTYGQRIQEYRDFVQQTCIREEAESRAIKACQDILTEQACQMESKRTSYFEFLYEQSRFIKKKWWVLQAVALLYLWMWLNNNATDMKGKTITYNRTKTKDRRLDKAQLKVDIPKLAPPLIEKYKDKSGKRLFIFYQYYVDEKGFNKAINYGLKEIGRLLEIDDLEYYAARHSWATIALNKVGIDKYTVHAALNHVDETMKVTDIYIERDFVNENKANAKVVKYVFGRM